jgi:hypothetical protein
VGCERLIMKTFLVASDELHAELLDGLVFARLQDEDHAFGSQWSGVWTDGTRYGILWASPVSDLFGVPEDFPELSLAEDANDEWTLVQPTATEGL